MNVHSIGHYNVNQGVGQAHITIMCRTTIMGILWENVFPFEVTNATTIDTKKIRNLKSFLQEEPKADWGYYVYQGEFSIDWQNKIICIPAWAIA